MIEINLTEIRGQDVVQLKRHVGRQLEFLGWEANDNADFNDIVHTALKRTFKCFSHLKSRYYEKNGVPFFSVAHTGQYTIFLYYLAHSLHFELKSSNLASGVYALNKMLHNVDLFYEVELPEIFYLDHPLGSVIGRASFKDYFQFRQNCTVGNNKGKFPAFGTNVHLWSGVTIVGNCLVGDHVVFSAGTYVKDQDIPSFSIVFGRSPNLIIKLREPNEARKSAYFATPF